MLLEHHIRCQVLEEWRSQSMSIWQWRLRWLKWLSHVFGYYQSLVVIDVIHELVLNIQIKSM